MTRIVCFLNGHRWCKRQYANDEPGAGHYLHCVRCGRDNHHTGTLHGHMGSLSLGL